MVVCGEWDNRAIREIELSKLNIEDAGERSEPVRADHLSLKSQPIIGRPGKAAAGHEMVESILGI